jgi:ceramide glucosyltransferase
MLPVTLVLVGLVSGSLIYCSLAIWAAWRYLAVKLPAPSALPPISILKALSGLDDGLADNLRSFFDQDYPAFEVIFAIRSTDDPAAAVARTVMAEFHSIPSTLLAVGESPGPNAKVFSLGRMLDLARHEVVLMADSDTRVTPGFLRVVAGEMSDSRVGLVTCPYLAVAGRSFWSGLEALGLNTEFLSGVLVARLLIGMDFALGPAIATRRSLLHQIGGLERLQNYLAEDFVMGNLMAASGHRVVLSSYRIEHRIGAQRLGANLEHRLRWARSTRRSRPLGYIGQLFTNPLPLALLLIAVHPSWWILATAAFVFRLVAAWAVTRRVLGQHLTFFQWLLVPLQDFASFVVWLSGFFGRTVMWRGRRYDVRQDGTFGLSEGEMTAG